MIRSVHVSHRSENSCILLRIVYVQFPYHDPDWDGAVTEQKRMFTYCPNCLIF